MGTKKGKSQYVVVARNPEDGKGRSVFVMESEGKKGIRGWLRASGYRISGIWRLRPGEDPGGFSSGWHDRAGHFHPYAAGDRGKGGRQ